MLALLSIVLVLVRSAATKVEIPRDCDWRVVIVVAYGVLMTSVGADLRWVVESVEGSDLSTEVQIPHNDGFGGGGGVISCRCMGW